MELNREQVKKELTLFIDDTPVELHFHHKKNAEFLSFLKLVLAVITTDEQKIFELENRLKECENGYEGTLFLESCKLHEAEEKVKELTVENEKLTNRLEKEAKCQYELAGQIVDLKAENERLRDFTKEQFKSAWTVREDTVRKMQERLKEKIHKSVYQYWNDGGGGYYLAEDVDDDIDQIAKEMVEDLNRDT